MFAFSFSIANSASLNSQQFVTASFSWAIRKNRYGSRTNKHYLSTVCCIISVTSTAVKNRCEYGGSRPEKSLINDPRPAIKLVMQPAGIKYKEFIGNERALLKYTNEFTSPNGNVFANFTIESRSYLHHTHMRTIFSGV